MAGLGVDVAQNSGALGAEIQQMDYLTRMNTLLQVKDSTFALIKVRALVFKINFINFEYLKTVLLKTNNNTLGFNSRQRTTAGEDLEAGIWIGG